MTHLTLPALPVGLPVLVQMQVQGGVCAEATYPTVLRNDAGGLRARGD